MPPLKLVAGVLVATVLIAAVAIARSGDGEEDASQSASVPDGYVTFEGELEGRVVSFAYPEDWGEVETRAGSIEDEIFFEVAGPPSAGGQGPAIKVGIQLESASPEAVLQANLASAQFQNEVEVTSEEETDVVGAVEGIRAEATYPVESGASGEEDFRSVLVVASAPDETAVLLIASGSAEDPGVDLDAVASSLRITASGETGGEAADA